MNRGKTVGGGRWGCTCQYLHNGGRRAQSKASAQLRKLYTRIYAWHAGGKHTCSLHRLPVTFVLLTISIITRVYAKTFHSPLRVSCKTLPSHAYILQAAPPRQFRQCRRGSPAPIGTELPLYLFYLLLLFFFCFFFYWKGG